MKLTILFALLSTGLFSQNLRVCNGESVKVPMRVEGDAVNLIWQIEPSGFIQEDGKFAQATITEYGVYNVTVEYESDLGCKYELFGTFQVDSCPIWTIWIANGISPNGENRSWIPNGENIELLSIEIFDRWGKVQFSTTNEPFYGLNNNGNELDGVFTYRVYFRETIKNSFQEKLGMLTVVR